MKSSTGRRRSKRKLFVLGTLAAIVVIIVAWQPAVGLVRGWRASRAVTRAESFAKKGDTANALFSLRLALRVAPFDHEGLQVAATVLEQAGSAEAVAIRRQLLALAPDDEPAREALVRTALRFGDVDAAGEAMAGIPAGQRNSPAAARLRAAIADASGTPAEREQTLTALLASSPGDELAQFELAALQLRQPAPAPDAQEKLQALAERGLARQPARRTLAEYAVQRRDAVAAMRWAERLATDRDATFADRLFQLNLERLVESPGAGRRLRELQSHVTQHPVEAASLATWMLLHEPPAEAARWLDSLPEATRSAAAVVAARADVAVLLEDWPEVRRRLVAGAWGPVAETTVDFAFTTRQLRARQRDDLASQLWEEALASAQDREPALRVLYRLALADGNPRDAEAALRAIAEKVPQQTWALQELLARAHRRRDTAAVRDVLVLWKQKQPQSRAVRSNWALAELLRDPSKPTETMRQLTREIHEFDRANPHFATTRALCLWRDEQPAAALAVLVAFEPVQLRAPGRALIYGSLLAELHRGLEARPYLEIASRGNLLPEETLMLRTARAKAGLAP